MCHCRQRKEYFYLYYYKPWTHLSVFAIGFYAGLLNRSNKYKLENSHRKVVSDWNDDYLCESKWATIVELVNQHNYNVSDNIRMSWMGDKRSAKGECEWSCGQWCQLLCCLALNLCDVWCDATHILVISELLDTFRDNRKWKTRE